MCGKKRQELARPLQLPKRGQGMRIFNHLRGNPGTR
jgi:hypothetical protein